MSTRPQLLNEETVDLNLLFKFADDSTLHAILDSADAPAVPEKAKELGEDRAVSLYRGGPREDYWSVAPYLLRLDRDALQWLMAALWDQPWGIFATSAEEIESLRAHFRKFLLVEMPDGSRSYFRFYDPRVIGGFLPACSKSELSDFYGPVQAFGIPGPERGTAKFWRK